MPGVVATALWKPWSTSSENKKDLSIIVVISKCNFSKVEVTIIKLKIN